MKDKDEIIEDQEKRIGELEDENQHLKKEFAKLKKEFEEFKAKHAGTVHNMHKALKIKPDLPQSPNPIGAKPRHKGHGRKAPTHVDREEPLPIDMCPYCNALLHGKTVSIRERLVTNIRIINPAEVIRYLLHRKWCSHCKKLVEPEVPGALPNARFSLNIMLLVMHLHFLTL